MSDDTWWLLLVALGCLSLAAKIISTWRYHRRDLRDLMDAGDGQGGVPPLPRRARKQAALDDYVQARARAALPREQPLDPAIAAGVEYLLLRDGDGVRHGDTDPAAGLAALEDIAAMQACLWCTPGVPVSVAAPEDCLCRQRCAIPWCAALERAAVASTEERKP